MKERKIRLLSLLSAALFSTFLSCGGDPAPPSSPVVRAGQGPADTEEMFGWIQDLCAMGYRRPGTRAEHRAEEYVARKFVSFGLEDVHLEPMDITLWNADTWSLTAGGEGIPCFTMPYCAFTGPSGVTAPMVYLQEGGPSDFASTDVRGKIVIVDMRFLDLEDIGLPIIEHTMSWVLTNWAAYDLAAEQGAAGFIGILRDYWDLNTYYAPADNPSKPLLTRTLPALWVNRSDGARLLEMLAGGAAAEATLLIDGTTGPAVTSNVVGFLPGMTDDIILVHSHHDAPFHGAVEDASGVSEVLALAKYFGQFPRWSREKTMMFLTATGHFYNYLGNATFVEQHRNDLIPRIRVDLCIEHISKDYDEIAGALVDMGRPELHYIFATGLLPATFATSAVEKHGLERTLVIPWPPWPDADVDTDALNYHEAGIPIVSLISAPEYLYDLIDTPDRVAKDLLLPVASAFIDIVKWMDLAPADEIDTW